MAAMGTVRPYPSIDKILKREIALVHIPAQFAQPIGFKLTGALSTNTKFDGDLSQRFDRFAA